jgi:hypothetical protein
VSERRENSRMKTENWYSGNKTFSSNASVLLAFALFLLGAWHSKIQWFWRMKIVNKENFGSQDKFKIFNIKLSNCTVKNCVQMCKANEMSFNQTNDFSNELFRIFYVTCSLMQENFSLPFFCINQHHCHIMRSFALFS